MNLKLTIFLIIAIFCDLGFAKKKHVVVIVADDLGWNDVSFHGSNQYLTPNIDALAFSGIILNNYYVLQQCSPSRSALLSGIHPINTGLYHNVLGPAQATGLPLDVKILPQYLKEYGYKTHAVGKWHLGNHKIVYTPTERGFDSHFGYWTGHEDYFTHELYGPEELNATDIKGIDFREGRNVAREYDGQYATDLFTQKSVDVINSHNASEPLFLYLAHLAVHAGNPQQPLQAPQVIIDKFSYIKNKTRRIFAAMAYKLDESVGKVVRALAEKDMLRDAIIIFTTDNGGAAGGYDQNMASNWPLKGGKNTLWEGGVRGAAFIWSADLPHSKVNNALMHIQDWVPTIIGAIDENANKNPKWKRLDGHNMWAVLLGQDESIYGELLLQRDDIRGIEALRYNNWKLIRGITNDGIYDKVFGPTGRNIRFTYNLDEIKNSHVAVVLKHNFSFPDDDEILRIRRNATLKCDNCVNNGIFCTPCDLRNDTCLFDVIEDPCERNNLAKKYPLVLADMLNRIKKYKPVPALFPPSDCRALPIFWNNTWTNWIDYVDEKFNNIETKSFFLYTRKNFLNSMKIFFGKNESNASKEPICPVQENN